MTRKTRREILNDGCYAHVMSRAVDGRFIFRDEQDFEVFKEYLRTKKEEHGFLLHHYCLMNTHFHLLVRMGEVKKFSQALQTIKWKYTHWYNRRYRRMGPLWRERFKSLLVENERYLYACGLYIEYNPVEAGLVIRSEEWANSSSRHYFDGSPDDLITRYEMQELPEGIDVRRRETFTQGDVIGSDLFKLYCEEELCPAI